MNQYCLQKGAATQHNYNYNGNFKASKKGEKHERGKIK